MRNASKALDCISCMSCFSACPVVGLGNLTDFAGPAPLVQLAQTALDIRNDPGKVARALELAGIFNCVSCYKCEEVCPAKIPIVTQIIEPLKAKTAALLPHAARHSIVFRAIIVARGRIDPSELVLRVQGLKVLLQLAALCDCCFAARSIRSKLYSENTQAQPGRRLISSINEGGP